MRQDIQLKGAPCLQDINNILNSGDVPNLMRPEDLEEIGGVLRPMMQAQVMSRTCDALQGQASQLLL